MRLHEKGGKEHELPCHHNLEQYLDEYIAARPAARPGIAGGLEKVYNSRLNCSMQLRDSQSDVWPDFERRTRSFHELYDEVSKQLLRIRTDEPGKAWLNLMIEGFHSDYEQWAKNRDYWPFLDRVELHANENEELRLVGHAYLHIGYDLPRIYARSVRAGIISRPRIRTLFSKCERPLREAFENILHKKGAFGWRGTALRAFATLGFRRTAGDIGRLAERFISELRGYAALTGENLADAPADLLPIYEERLWTEIDKISHYVMRGDQTLENWLANLDSPVVEMDDHIQFRTPFKEVNREDPKLQEKTQDAPQLFLGEEALPTRTAKD